MPDRRRLSDCAPYLVRTRLSVWVVNPHRESGTKWQVDNPRIIHCQANVHRSRVLRELRQYSCSVAFGIQCRGLLDCLVGVRTPPGDDGAPPGHAHRGSHAHRATDTSGARTSQNTQPPNEQSDASVEFGPPQTKGGNQHVERTRGSWALRRERNNHKCRQRQAGNITYQPL